MSAENDDQVRQQLRAPDTSTSAEPEGGQSGHWTWRGGLRRAAEVLRMEGAKTLLLRMLAETIYRTMIVTERPLEDQARPAGDYWPPQVVRSGSVRGIRSHVGPF
jgi:hypothetical protein